jgi:hypothetical protein
MAHNLEIVNGKAQMAYAGELPRHGLGVEVPADLTPDQMLEAAGQLSANSPYLSLRKQV